MNNDKNLNSRELAAIFDRKVARFMAPSNVRVLRRQVEEGLEEFDMEKEREGCSLGWQRVNRYLYSLLEKMMDDWVKHGYIKNIKDDDLELINLLRQAYHNREPSADVRHWDWKPSMEFIYETMEFPENISVEQQQQAILWYDMFKDYKANGRIFVKEGSDNYLLKRAKKTDIPVKSYRDEAAALQLLEDLDALGFHRGSAQELLEAVGFYVVKVLHKEII